MLSRALMRVRQQAPDQRDGGTEDRDGGGLAPAPHEPGEQHEHNSVDEQRCQPQRVGIATEQPTRRSDVSRSRKMAEEAFPEGPQPSP